MFSSFCFFFFFGPLRSSPPCNQCALCIATQMEDALFRSTIPLVVFSSERQAIGHSLAGSQKLLQKLLSSANLSQFYLFIICSRAALLTQGIVRRGNFSLPPHPSSHPSLSLKAVVVFLHCSSEGSEARSNIVNNRHPLWGTSPQIQSGLIYTVHNWFY